jgi:hypothetical protein
MMNETAKTSIFVLLAVALIAGAIFSRPTVSEFKTEEMLGKSLFPQFTDPLGIQSLEIVQLNLAGERNDFRIVEVEGIWSIPSHDNYPADARDQMGNVAEALTGLKVLEVIQPEGSGVDSIAFQAQYGVIDPTTDSASLGEGVGLKIVLGGANNETLVNLIIGKAVARGPSQNMMDEEETGLRYVRVANQSPVYVVDIDPSRFSMNFGEWIERNLLDISTLDIKEFFVDQYSFSVEYALTQMGLQERPDASFIGDITLAYDGSAIGADKWSLLRWMVFEGQNLEYKERQLDPMRELNADTLDSMVSALNDLKIVNVRKKPAGLAAVLREGTTFDNVELDAAMQSSMQATGFWLVELRDLKGNIQQTKVQLLSNKGDLQLRLKDGIVYHLRFGDLTGTESEIIADDALDTTPIMGVNRYLFITAEFDPAIIPPPELKPLPEIPAEGDADELEELNQQREITERANQREQERYDAALESGKKRAAELSDRFADWYYVISEDVYRKIHLTEANVFRFKTQTLETESVWDGTIPGLPEIEPPLSTDHLPELPQVEISQPDLSPINVEVEETDIDTNNGEK